MSNIIKIVADIMEWHGQDWISSECGNRASGLYFTPDREVVCNIRGKLYQSVQLAEFMKIHCHFSCNELYYMWSMSNDELWCPDFNDFVAVDEHDATRGYICDWLRLDDDEVIGFDSLVFLPRDEYNSIRTQYS
jgi:hypothetical protein